LREQWKANHSYYLIRNGSTSFFENNYDILREYLFFAQKPTTASSSYLTRASSPKATKRKSTDQDGTFSEKHGGSADRFATFSCKIVKTFDDFVTFSCKIVKGFDDFSTFSCEIVTAFDKSVHRSATLRDFFCRNRQRV